MKSENANIVGGIVLMTLGVLWLLDTLHMLEGAAYVPALIFAAVGVVFLSVFLRRREYWWAAIPGSVFLGLAAVIAATQFTDGGAGAAFLFLFMSAGFGVVYVREPDKWWALIPCGVLFTLGFIVVLPQEQLGSTVPAVLFLGFAATFGVLSLVPVRTSGHIGRMKWPLIPAAVLAVLGVIFTLQAMALLIEMDFAIPAMMILAGVALLVYAYLTHRDGQRKAHGTSAGAG